MIARIRKSMEEKDQGFTLIELLVVMVIVGILSAIAIPTFLNQRNKAYDTAAKSDVANIGREVATYFVDTDTSPGAFTFNAASATGSGTWSFAGANTPSGKISKSVTAGSAPNVTAAAWCVQLTSKSTSIFSYSASGPKDGVC